jgi:hypothetical protein
MQLNPGQLVVELEPKRVGTFVRDEELNYVTVNFDGTEELLGRDDIELASAREIACHQINLEWNEVLALVRSRSCLE